MTMHKHHETRGYNDGLWQTYNGHSLDGDARDAYDVGYEQGCEEHAAKARIERDNPLCHSTYDGRVSLCGRRFDANYSATNKPRCEKCAAAKVAREMAQ